MEKYLGVYLFWKVDGLSFSLNPIGQLCFGPILEH